MSDFPPAPWEREPPTDATLQPDRHLQQLEAESEQSRLLMRRISRKSFIWAGVSVLAGWGATRLIDTRRSVNGTPWPFRISFQANEQLQRDLFADRLAPTFDPARGSEPTVNLLDEEQNQDDIDAADWRLSVEGLHGHDEPVKLTMAQLRKLPIVEQTTELNCIEGWTNIVHWKGIRFRDLAKHLGPATESGDAPDIDKKREDLLDYVALETVEGLYYVGLDIASALHPQTLLAFEMNGKPLTTEHGYPLRLVIPVKYGIKNIKRIGKINFTSERPKDYWAEQGYDWYSGL
jgi:DMSO/TMAO reductase YedYZ molybdopterin-dependent catalytic subunit